MSEFVLEKGPTLASKIGPSFWSLVYPKCSKLEVYNPRVMILEMFSIIYKSNDSQIFHLQNKLWGLQIIHEACFVIQVVAVHSQVCYTFVDLGKLLLQGH